MAELLVEIRTAGYPAEPLAEATTQLKDALVRALRAAKLGPQQSAIGFTVRRMMVLLRGLPECEGVATRERLAQVLEQAVSKVRWADGLYWDDGKGPWIRPVTGVLAVLDGEVVPAKLFGVAASDSTVGHPVLSPRRFRVANGDQYGKKLAQRGIEVRQSERERLLGAAIEQAAKDAGGTLVPDPALLVTLSRSCEVPGVIVGALDPEDLRMPRELLAACLGERLRAYAVEAEGDLLPYFVAVMDRPDDPQGRVRLGFELAAKAHFEDLRFHYSRDQETSISVRARSLADHVLEPSLGTFGERADRLASLCQGFCSELGWEGEADRAAEAAQLLDADRTCVLVSEFPELRGVIGGLLARDEGYPESVWQAIYDHRGQGPFARESPRGRIGRVAALADRVDTLVGRAAAGETDGDDSQRQAALAESVVRLLIEAELPLDIDLVAARSARLFGRGDAGPEGLVRAVRQALDHGVERVLMEQAFARDEIHAVLSADGGRQLPQLRQRLQGIRGLRSEAALRGVVQTARRLVDILHESVEADLEVELLVAEAEKDLYVLYQKLRRPLEGAMAAGHYREWLSMMGSLAGGVDRFFREVLVRDEVESVRQNRLALLQSVHRLFARQIRLAELTLETTDS